MPRSKKAYRIGELDKLISVIFEAIPGFMVGKNPSVAIRLMTTYLQAMKQLAEEAGDFTAGDIENKWIQLMGDADLEQKKQLTEKLLDLEQLAKDIQKQKGQGGPSIKSELREIPNVPVVDAEFEVEDA